MSLLITGKVITELSTILKHSFVLFFYPFYSEKELKFYTTQTIKHY